jgi:hypothetical protein
VSNDDDPRRVDLGEDRDRIVKALGVAFRYGGTDGAHHKAWVIDQMVRALTGDGYQDWVRERKDGDDGPESYGWDEGVPP